MAREKYDIQRTIARVNNPRNRELFDLLGVAPVVSATDLILRLIEHEVPSFGLVHLLDLHAERLEIVEVEVTEAAPAAGMRVADISMPEGSLIISVLRKGAGFVPKADTRIEAGDEVLVVLDPGLEDGITGLFAVEA
jgi:trk system potassium uptake protein TrkA